MEVYLHSFFTTALHGGDSFCFMPWPKRDWVDPRAGLEVFEKRKILVQAWSQNTTPCMSRMKPSHYPASTFYFMLGTFAINPIY
jgi:hypothetical protein